MITRRMTQLIEEQQWDEDLKQELYVQLLESEELLDLRDINTPHLLSMLRQRYHNIRMNQMWKDRNRSRIEEDNVASIRAALGLVGAHDDPLDVLLVSEEIQRKLIEMSSLLRGTLESIALLGKTPEELAEEEGVTANTIYQRVWEAKKQLQ